MTQFQQLLFKSDMLLASARFQVFLKILIELVIFLAFAVHSDLHKTKTGHPELRHHF